MKRLTKIFTFLLIFTVVGCDFKSDKQEYAEMIIEKVEKFKDRNERLPKDVSEIGLTEMEDSPAFYEKTSDSTYKVWYGLGLGESRTYNSKTQEWTKGG